MQVLTFLLAPLNHDRLDSLRQQRLKEAGPVPEKSSFNVAKFCENPVWQLGWSVLDKTRKYSYGYFNFLETFDTSLRLAPGGQVTWQTKDRTTIIYIGAWAK
jgi:hypothetical protein